MASVDACAAALGYLKAPLVVGLGGGSALDTAKQVAVRLGWDPAVAARVEGARGRMKRLVERGWLVEERPGRFTLSAPGPAAAAG